MAYINGTEVFFFPNGTVVSGGAAEIKTITFTDRPSLWEFLNNNTDNVLQIIYPATLDSNPVYFNCLYHGDGKIIVNRLFTRFGTGYDGNFYQGVYLDITSVELTSSECTLWSGVQVNFKDGSYSDSNVPSSTTIADGDWSTLGMQVTVYYYESAGVTDA